MIASSLTCRVLRAVWLWLAALGQSSRVFGAIGRCYRASGTHRTLARWLGAEPRALASSRYTRAFTNENARLSRKTKLRAAIESSVLCRIYRAVLRCGQNSRILSWLFSGGVTGLILVCIGLYAGIDYVLRDLLAIPVLGSMWDEALLLFAALWICGQRIEARSPLAARTTPMDCGILLFLTASFVLMNVNAPFFSIQVSGFRASQEQSVLYFWLGAAAFTLQIYYDFSGYSDMAIGLGRILGFHFPENFRYPYCAGSITEFWRRWHISLGSWFRDYLYIPLGGNRKGKGRQLLNILLVWLATGLWHGADWTFVLWGLLYAALLTAEKLFLLRGLKKLRVLNHIYVLLFVTLGFVLFDADSVRSAAASVCAMFGGGGLPLAGQESLYALRSGAVLLLSAAVGATPLPRRLITAVQQKQAGRAVLAVLEPVGLCLLLAVCTAFLVDGSFNPFLYFRF